MESKALGEKLKDAFSLNITEETQENLHLQLVSEYADLLFCFEKEQEIKREEYKIILGLPEYEHRFYGEDNLVNLYLQMGEKTYLLGTALVEDNLYFLPLSENEAGVFYQDEDIRRMITENQKICDRFEYIWVDEVSETGSLLVSGAQEISTNMPGTLWEPVEEEKGEIFLTDKIKYIYVDLMYDIFIKKYWLKDDAFC